MTKTVYLVVHVDYPEDELLIDILDPSAENKPAIYLKKDLAEQTLSDYLQQGLEYTLKVLTVTLS